MSLGGGMADTTDLKSVAPLGREGSTPSPGTLPGTVFRLPLAGAVEQIAAEPAAYVLQSAQGDPFASSPCLCDPVVNPLFCLGRGWIKTMRSLLAILILLALAPSVHSASNSLWVVEGSNGTVYLQASVHFLRPSDYPLDPAIEQAFTDSERLVLETDLGQAAAPETQALLLSKGTLPFGLSLRAVLKEETYELAKTEMAEMGLDIAFFEMFKPWFLAMSISALKLQALGFSPHHGLDMHFHESARAAGVTPIALESLEEQIGMLDGFSLAEQDAQLAHALEELDRMDALIADIVSAWKRGDVARLEALLLEGFEPFPEVYEKLVVKRNRTWLPIVENLLAEKGNTMVVVGAAHVVGENGLLDLLREKGYSVEQR